MQKTVLASLIVLALSACDSDSADPMDVVANSSDGSTTMTDGSGNNSGNGNSAGDTDASGSVSDDGASDNNAGGNDASGSNENNENAGNNNGGSNNSGGESTGSGDGKEDGGKEDTDYSNDNFNDSGKNDSDNMDTDSQSGGTTGGAGTDNNNQISDDAGSATSDGGQVSDDAGSATSDGGQVSDDAGSATSDGGQVTDDSGSSTSDGGNNTADTSDNNNNVGNNNGGAFESDSVGGNTIYQSSFAATTSTSVCTTQSAQNNFSDIRFGDFIVHNNAWRPWRAAEGYEWEQCVYTNQNGAVTGWNYDWGPGRTGINGNQNASGDFYVRSYPELIYGVKDEFRTSAPKSRTGLPVRFGDMPNISIDYSYSGPQFGESRVVDASNNARFPNGTLISGERNIAIESFFYNPDSSGQCSDGIVTRAGGSNHTYEVMVWLDAGAERLPAGPSDYVTDVSIRGAAYKVYTKNADRRYIAFVAQNPQNSGTVFWNDFTDWAKTYAHRVEEEFSARSNAVQMSDDWCMANILVGTEIFWGAGNLDIYNWTITQKR